VDQDGYYLQRQYLVHFIFRIHERSDRRDRVHRTCRSDRAHRAPGSCGERHQRHGGNLPEKYRRDHGADGNLVGEHPLPEPRRISVDQDGYYLQRQYLVHFIFRIHERRHRCDRAYGAHRAPGSCGERHQRHGGNLPEEYRRDHSADGNLVGEHPLPEPRRIPVDQDGYYLQRQYLVHFIFRIHERRHRRCRR
jgi:hypothetical protein